SHDAPPEDDHAQPLSVVTCTAAVPPVELMAAFDGETANVHGAAAWLIVTFSPFTATAPLRADGTGFAATRTSMAPLPCPLVGPSVIHDVGVEADQVQSRSVFTLTVASAPAAGAVVIELVAVTEHFSPVGAVTLVFDDVQAGARAASASERTNKDVSRIP